MTASSSRMTRTSADCRATCSMAAPQLGALAAQAVLYLPGRPGQVGEQELHLAELGAHRLGRGEHLVLELLVPGLDRGPEGGAARVDLAQHHGDVRSHLAGVSIVGGQDLPQAPADLPLQVTAGRAGGGVRRPHAVHGCGHRVSQGAGPDRGQDPDPGHGRGAVQPAASARAGPSAAAHSRGSTAGAGRPRSSRRPCRAARSSHSRIPAWSRRASSKSPKPSTPTRP